MFFFRTGRIQLRYGLLIERSELFNLKLLCGTYEYFAAKKVESVCLVDDGDKLTFLLYAAVQHGYMVTIIRTGACIPTYTVLREILLQMSRTQFIFFICDKMWTFMPFTACSRKYIRNVRYYYNVYIMCTSNVLFLLRLNLNYITFFLYVSLLWSFNCARVLQRSYLLF